MHVAHISVHIILIFNVSMNSNMMVVALQRNFGAVGFRIMSTIKCIMSQRIIIYKNSSINDIDNNNNLEDGFDTNINGEDYDDLPAK